MEICCKYSAHISDLTSLLLGKSSHAYMVLMFLSEEKNRALTNLFSFFKWFLKLTEHVENNFEKKSIELCKHISLIYSHITDFFWVLTDGSYLHSHRFTYLNAFNQGHKITEEAK